MVSIGAVMVSQEEWFLLKQGPLPATIKALLFRGLWCRLCGLLCFWSRGGTGTGVFNPAVEPSIHHFNFDQLTGTDTAYRADHRAALVAHKGKAALQRGFMTEGGEKFALSVESETAAFHDCSKGVIIAPGQHLQMFAPSLLAANQYV